MNADITVTKNESSFMSRQCDAPHIWVERDGELALACDFCGLSVVARRDEPRQADVPLTGEAHRLRHVLLHRMLDELYADFLRHGDDMARAKAGAPFGLERPLSDLLKWAFEQTQQPTEPT